MIEILNHTPLYVYWMFFSLLIVGLMQRRTRNLSKNRALIIPSILILLSLMGLLSDFGANLLTILSSFLGFILSTFIIYQIQIKFNIFSTIVYNKNSNNFTIKGSFIPLCLFMLVFFIKYIVGFIKSTNVELFSNIYFILLFCFLYGVFISIFFIRFYILWQKSKI